MRALAVVAVLLYHADVPWMRGGFLGVDVFFVLSGYLVTSLVLGSLGRDGAMDLRSFWVGRARRLAPALLTLLVVTTLAVAVLHRSELADLRGQVLSALTGTTNWYLIVSDSSYFDQLGRPPYLRHLWSIAVELQFYFVVPPLLAVVLRREGGRLDRVVLGLGVAIAASAIWMAVLFDSGTDPSRPYYSTFTRLLAPLVGAVLALLWRRRNLVRAPVARAGPRVFGAGIAAMVALGVLMRWAGDRDAWMYRGGFLLVALLSAVVVAAVVHPASPLGGRRALGHPVLVAIGVRSYCLYLWHWPVFVLLRPGIDVSWGWGPVFVLRMTLTVALTELCYRFVERPWHKGARHAASSTQLAPDALRRRRLAVALAAGASLIAVVALVFARPEPDAIEDSLAAGQAALAAATPAPTTAPPPPPTTLPPGPTEPGATTTAPPTTVPPPPEHRTVIIGDSLIVGAAPDLLGTFGDTAVVDAAVGRQAGDMDDALRQARSRLPDADTIVVQLGNNGTVTEQDITDVVAAAEGDRVVFVNARVPRSWEGSNNTLLAEVVPTLENASLLDWHALSADRGDWFLSDGIHLTAEGRKAFSEAVIAEVEG